MSSALLSATAPSEEEAREARHLLDRLRLLGEDPRPLRLHVAGASGGLEPEEPITLPPLAMRLLVALLNELASGNAVALLPLHAELSVQETADLLDASPAFVLDLMERGELHYHHTGPCQMIRLVDTLEYKERVDLARREVLAELAAEAQELGLGY
jgi:hypothetical protein